MNENKKDQFATMQKEKIWDLIIVGAGPAGSSCAYYAAKNGLEDILLLDKAEFPRRKICGDAISIRAQKHLKEMGILQEVLEENKGNKAAIGGLCSPSGIKFEFNSAEELREHLMIAIKREIMDEKLVRASEAIGVELREHYDVKDASFDEGKKTWTIFPKEKNKEEYSNSYLQTKMLVLADGAVSAVGRSIGNVSTPPDAVCSSVYIKKGTHNYKGDGMVFYTEKLMPGYAAIFREADGDLVFCCYIIPGGQCKIGDLSEMHHNLLHNHEQIKNLIGPNADIEEMKTAPIRFGGVKPIYNDRLLIIGDAAGHVDPFTGEGIQYAMDSGKIAAEVLVQGFEKGDLSKAFLKKYKNRCKEQFMRDFKYSGKIVKFMAKHPTFIDAFASVCKRKGAKFMLKWGKIMTGATPKSDLLKPSMVFPILWELIRLKILHKNPED